MPVPVLSVAQMREWENATWAGGQTEAAVIARVGECVARRALELTHSGNTILLLAGRGHNGDDVRAMLPHLHRRTVKQLDVCDPSDALAQIDSALKQSPALLVDGMFGIGLTRPLSEHWQRLIELVNGAPCLILAVDIPSGLDAETGRPSPSAVRASITLTIGAPKRGLLKSAAAPFIGRLEVAGDVGLPPCPVTGDSIGFCRVILRTIHHDAPVTDTRVPSVTPRLLQGASDFTARRCSRRAEHSARSPDSSRCLRKRRFMHPSLLNFRQ